MSESKSGLLLSNAEIKPVSQCYTKYITNRSMSITVILQQHETKNTLFPTQKQITTHMNSFFSRAIRFWSKLPTKIKDAPTVPAFASGLNKFMLFIRPK